MRSILSRVVLSSFLLATLGLASPATAAPTPKAVTRDGQPWLEVRAHGPRATTRTTTSVTPASLAQQARRLVNAPGLDLSVHRNERLKDGERLVRLSQSHMGLPVVGRGATVRFDASGAPLMIARDLETELPSSVKPTLDAARARASVRASQASLAGLVVWPTRGGGSRLAWVIFPERLPGTPSAPRLVVDATTGELLEARDLVTFATASVYASNPVKSPTLADLPLRLDPTDGVLTNPLLISENCIDKKSVKPFDFLGIKGSAHLCDLEQTAKADEAGNFVFAPADVPGSVEARSDTYSEVSMYYHAAHAYAFFRELAGDPEAQVVEDKPLRVVANLQLPAGLLEGDFQRAANPEIPLEPFSNAFFSPASGGLGDVFSQLFGVTGGGLWFGQGPQRDYAYDGDVVYHEFTHAVVDETLRLGAWSTDAFGAIDAPGAMNEGIADYFSSAITGDPDVGEYASKDLGSGDVIRTLANNDACPANVVGEVHVDSTLFSGALWQGRMGLPTAEDHAKFDEAVYKAMRSNPGRGDLGFEDLANLILAVLDTDLPAGAATFRDALTVRGILPSCRRVLELAAGTVFRVRSPIYPGLTSPGGPSIGVRNLAPSVVQFHTTVATGATKLDVTFDAQDMGGVAGLIGGAKPYKAEILVKFGAPITWTFQNAKSSNDADLQLSGDTATTTFDVPAGATDVYVQLANSGQSDGLITKVQVDFPTPAAPAEAPVEEAPAAADSEGCGCATPGSRVPDGAALPALGLALAGALVLRSKRRTAETDTSR